MYLIDHEETIQNRAARIIASPYTRHTPVTAFCEELMKKAWFPGLFL